MAYVLALYMLWSIYLYYLFNILKYKIFVFKFYWFSSIIGMKNTFCWFYYHIILRCTLQQYICLNYYIVKSFMMLLFSSIYAHKKLIKEKTKMMLMRSDSWKVTWEFSKPILGLLRYMGFVVSSTLLHPNNIGVHCTSYIILQYRQLTGYLNKNNLNIWDSYLISLLFFIHNIQKYF